MAYTPKHPALYDSLPKISISYLKKKGCIPPGTSEGYMVLDKGCPTFRLNSYPMEEHPYIALSYRFNGERRTCKILLTSTLSNLKNGFVWYFTCPLTGKKCRNLYFIQGYYCHRETFANCMYKSQSLSKSHRIIKAFFKSALEGSEEPYFKKTYKGKPTKRYAKMCSDLMAVKKDQDYDRLKWAYSTLGLDISGL